RRPLSGPALGARGHRDAASRFARGPGARDARRGRIGRRRVARLLRAATMTARIAGASRNPHAPASDTGVDARRRAGFTLLEVMLALPILGIVATAVYGTFSRTLRSKQIADERADVLRTGRAALARMADEIASAFYPQEPAYRGEGQATAI